jgi:hypothetical protein
MANDRIFVGCCYCGETAFLDKYYPGCQSLTHADTSYYKPEKLADFLELHVQCNPNYGGADLGQQPLMIIVPESGTTADNKRLASTLINPPF